MLPYRLYCILLGFLPRNRSGRSAPGRQGMPRLHLEVLEGRTVPSGIWAALGTHPMNGGVSRRTA